MLNNIGIVYLKKFYLGAGKKEKYSACTCYLKYNEV